MSRKHTRATPANVPRGRAAKTRRQRRRLPSIADFLRWRDAQARRQKYGSHRNRSPYRTLFGVDLNSVPRLIIVRRNA